MSQLLVGAGGWGYFQVPGADSLEVYSRAFDFVELNSSYYQLPDVSTATDWRRKVREDFQFSVRCPRIMADNYGLELLPGSRTLLKHLEEVCISLDAPVMTILIGRHFPVRHHDMSSRIRTFLEVFEADKTLVALEFRDMEPNAEVLDIMRDQGAVHCVDISKQEPRYPGKILYSRLFGKGEENIYEFDDEELRDISKKASDPKFEKSILAFHGVRMYRDAGRVRSYIEKGYFPKITTNFGVDSVREVLREDARFPASKSNLIKDQGWKVFQDVGAVRRISSILENISDREYNSLDDLMIEMNHRTDLFGSN